MKVLRTLRNHWKKSTLAVVLLGYGYKYAREKVETMQLMRAYCEEAKKYGEATLPTGRKPRHITVILNPTSKDGKSKKLYEQYSAPLFHLAGIKVSLVETEYEGQAKGLMEVMDNTDAVVIAGGDGTISESITGLLRREDKHIAAKRFPIGVIPLGQTNTVARSLFFNKSQSLVRWIAEASMAIVKETCKPMDVMHVQGDSGKPVYAVGKIDWGLYRDVHAKVHKYWYWGPLKSEMAYFFSMLRNWPSSVELKMSYTLPCTGCSKCHSETLVTDNQQRTRDTSYRWWHVFLRPKPIVQFPAVSSVDYTNIVNDECGVWKDKHVKATEVCVATKQAFPQWDPEPLPCLQVRIVNDKLNAQQFVTEGLSHIRVGKASDEVCEIVEAQEIQLEPVMEPQEVSWYSIDSEPFEVKPITVKLLPNQINFYCQSESS